VNAQQIKTLWARRPARIMMIAVVVGAAALAFLRPRTSGSDKVDMKHTLLCQVQRGDLAVSILQSGMLLARNSREILNEAFDRATIVTIVEDGAFVTNGQLLVELEASKLLDLFLDAQSDVAVAEANLTFAREELEIARLQQATDLESAKLEVELAKLDLQKYTEVAYTQSVDIAGSDIMLAAQELEQARGELEGTKELYQKGYSNKQELESDQLGVNRKDIEVRNKTKDLEILRDYSSVKTLKELQNEVSKAESALERLKKTFAADRMRMEAMLESNQTRLKMQQNKFSLYETQLENTKIFADFDGQVFYPKGSSHSHSYRSVVEQVEKGALLFYRQKILSFPDLSAWNILVGVPEAMIDKVAVGQEMVATLDALPGVLLQGRVKQVSAVPDSQSYFSSGVKTYSITIEVLTKTEAKLKPGMSATVEIVTDRLSDVLYVPIQSVVSDAAKRYVYVVRRSRKKLREVQVGKYNTSSIEIISGLEEGEELLLNAEVKLDADSKLRKSPLLMENKGRETKIDMMAKPGLPSAEAPRDKDEEVGIK
jgi:HlyD family secretion protein